MKSMNSRGEDRCKTGPKGRSQRPSSTRDASASPGVDPQDPPGMRSTG